MQVIRYNETLHDVWNAFIEDSRNGTFLLKREYMDYHADRFADCSFLFMEGMTCIAVLPGNLNGTTYHSHQGLTYGCSICACRAVSKVCDLVLAHVPVPCHGNGTIAQQNAV